VKATDEQIVRVFKQMQGGLEELPIGSMNVFGQIVGFITTTLQLCEQMRQAGRLPHTVEDAQRELLADFRTNGKIMITQSEIDPHMDNGLQSNADLRHLRNCFAHGNWTYDVSEITSEKLEVELYDFNKSGAQRFAATIELINLIDLAEQLMVVTSKVIFLTFLPTTPPSGPTP
jgi:hypothetical protein